MTAPTTTPGRTRFWWYAGALVVADAFYWVFYLLYINWADYLPINQGLGPFLRGADITLATLAGLLAITCGMAPLIRPDRQTSPLRRGILIPVLAVFFWMHWQVWDMCQHAPGLFVEDVGRTTIAADHLLLHAANPFSARLDTDADAKFPGRNMGGYKYLPVMMAAYMPAAILCKDGNWGVLTANLVFSVIAGMILGLCVWRWISLDAALFCLMLFYMPRIITEENFRHGNNDTVPMILLIAALYLLDRRFVCGLLVGLAISAKLLPGLLWIPIGLSPRKPAKYFAGIAVGLLPCLPFFLAGPRDFVSNIFLFSLQRPVEDTSLAYGMPAWAGGLIKLPAAAVFLYLCARAAKKDGDPLRRCGWAAGLTLCVQLGAPMVHPNYFVWWFMPFCVVVTGFVFSLPCPLRRSTPFHRGGLPALF